MNQTLPLPTASPTHWKRLLRQIHQQIDHIERQFPPPGQETAILSLQLTHLATQMAYLGAASLHPTHTHPIWEANWQTLIHSLQPHLSPTEQRQLLQYPQQLQVFQTRHKRLAHLPPQPYGKIDEELQSLTQPLKRVSRMLQRDLFVRLTTPEQRRQRTALIWTSVGLALLASTVLFAFVMLQRTIFPIASVSLPTQALTGGITGIYTQQHPKTGSPQHQVKRNDPQIAMTWKASPIRGIKDSYFRVVWQGYVKATRDGVHPICLKTSHHGTLHIARRRHTYHATKGTKREYCIEPNLRKGWHHLRVLFQKKTKPAFIDLQWKPPYTTYFRTIPQKALCCKYTEHAFPGSLHKHKHQKKPAKLTNDNGTQQGSTVRTRPRGSSKTRNSSRATAPTPARKRPAPTKR
jgi:hypothetical protein